MCCSPKKLVDPSVVNDVNLRKRVDKLAQLIIKQAIRKTLGTTFISLAESRV